jgi:cell division protein FtsW
MARAGTKAVTRGGRSRANSGEQLTITGFVEDLAKKAEVHDPLRPATRLFLVVLALMAIGFLVQISHAATTTDGPEFLAEVRSQAAFRLAAVFVLLAGFRLGPSGVRRFLPHVVVLTGVALLCVYIEPFRSPRNGAFRWVELHPIGIPLAFQPSELARVVLVLWVADRCVKLGSLVYDLRRGVMPMVGVVLAFFFAILFETDLGGSMLLLLCALATMWVGGARLRSVSAWFVAIGGGVIAAANVFVPYMRDRIAMWMGHVQNDQVTLTLDALSSGGVAGAGLTHGQFRNDGVPYLQSDYVFALIGEELGLLGMWLVLALLVAFLWFSLRLVLSLRERFDALASFGLLVSVGLQAMLHVQVVSGLAPPKGMTLPFLSDGGTSLIVSALAVGLALGAAKKTHEDLYPCNPSNATG